MNRVLFFLIIVSFLSVTAYGGNPDRQGEAGAYELLMNPWARSAGFHTMNTAFVTGVDAIRLNVAGMANIKNTEIVLGSSRYLSGAGINMNSVGFTQKLGKSSAIGISLMALDFGDIQVTREGLPEGTGGTFSPRFFNLGVAYAHAFENKVSVGVTFRSVSEAISDVKASSFAVDAGVQYVAGDEDNFKLGISLRNIGAPMKFKGQGLTFGTFFPNGANTYEQAVEQRANKFELPSVLNMGISYDFKLNPKNSLTVLGNFTSNAFSQDQLGGGVEYTFNKIFSLRGAYKYEVGGADNKFGSLYTGPSAGLSVAIPFATGSDEGGNKSGRVGFDYAYRHTKIHNGTHNLSVRISF